MAFVVRLGEMEVVADSAAEVLALRSAWLAQNERHRVVEDAGLDAQSREDIAEAVSFLTLLNQDTEGGGISSSQVSEALSVDPKGLGSALVRIKRAIVDAEFDPEMIFSHRRTASGRLFYACRKLGDCLGVLEDRSVM